MPVLHKFSSPTAIAVSIDGLGMNLPFEFGPWKSLGSANLIAGRDTNLVHEVLDKGYSLTARPVPLQS